MARRSRLLLGAIALAIVALVWFGIWRTGRTVVAPPAGVRPGGQLVSSIRSEPRTFNRYAGRDSTTETISHLTQAKLVRVNRETQEAEPWLAETWTASPDNLTYTLKLRPDVKFSDGVPFTSADVVFAFQAIYDEKTGSPIAESMRVRGKPLEVSAPDATTVVIRFPSPFGPGLRLLDNLPIAPKHRLEAALQQGTLASAWGPTTPPAEIAGLGPFMLREYQAGHRLVFEKNPYYWRKDNQGVQLPYLDRLTLEIVPDQNAELLRLDAGQLDFLQNEIRSEDYATLKRAADAGRVRLVDLGVGLDADSLWFNLKQQAKASDPRRSWLQSTELRRAISYAVDRTAFADSVFLGAAVPVFGPVTPGNRLWYAPDLPRQDYDPTRARTELQSLGLSDRNGDGVLEDPSRAPVRFTLITQKGNTSLERGAAIVRDDLAKVGIAVDVVGLEVGALIDRLERSDYDALYYRFLTTDLDPALNLDFWLSSGGAHVWDTSQSKPATAWEGQIDGLMEQQAATVDRQERKRLVDQAQRIFAEHLPIIYFVAPRVYVAMSSRVRNATPALLRPTILWNADVLAVAKPAEPGG